MLDQIIDNFRPVTLNQLVHRPHKVVPVQEWLRLLLVELPMISLLHLHRRETPLASLIHARIYVRLADIASFRLVGATRNRVPVLT